MGWCSATEIMDAAIQGAESAVHAALGHLGGERPLRPETVERVDQALAPFVATLAEKLRDSDWDCIEESAYFERFPQEMLGHDDRRYIEYLMDRLRDTEPDECDFADLVRKLANVTERVENN